METCCETELGALFLGANFDNAIGSIKYKMNKR